MRPLGLTDTIFYNLRDAQITAVVALDGPCDLATLIANAAGVVADLPGYAETPVRLGLWSFARRPAQPLDLADHIFVAREPGITDISGLTPLLDRLRRARIAMAGPPWRIIVLNPAGSGEPAGGVPQSAVFFQMRHGLGDGMRAVQAIARLDGRPPSAEHAAQVRGLRPFDFASLPRDIAVEDAGLTLVRIARRAIDKGGGVSLALATAARAAVSDAALFPHAQPLRGNVGRTRFVLRRGAPKGVGNHLKMETLRSATGPQQERRLHIPGLARAQELPLSQWLVALAPGALARVLMRVWYRNFDAIATLIPVPRRMKLGGRNVTAMFGVPPLWSAVPLAVFAIANAETYDIALLPGRGFSADPALLEAKLRALLSPDTAPPQAARSR